MQLQEIYEVNKIFIQKSQQFEPLKKEIDEKLMEMKKKL